MVNKNTEHLFDYSLGINKIKAKFVDIKVSYQDCTIFGVFFVFNYYSFYYNFKISVILINIINFFCCSTPAACGKCGSKIVYTFACSAQLIVNKRRSREADRNPSDFHSRVERACRDAKDLRCLIHTRPRWTRSYLSERRIALRITRRSRNDKFLLATGFSTYYKMR